MFYGPRGVSAAVRQSQLGNAGQLFYGFLTAIRDYLIRMKYECATKKKHKKENATNKTICERDRKCERDKRGVNIMVIAIDHMHT